MPAEPGGVAEDDEDGEGGRQQEQIVEPTLEHQDDEDVLNHECQETSVFSDFNFHTLLLLLLLFADNLVWVPLECHAATALRVKYFMKRDI